LVTGCSRVSTKVLLDDLASDTTLLVRRDDLVAARVCDQSRSRALHADGRIIGLNFSGVAIARSPLKAHAAA